MTQPNDPRKVKVIVELIDHTSRIADLNDRGDLVERLDVAKERISDPQIRVVIAGQLKQGKSQLLNSLLNMPVARVGDDETTALATVVHLRGAGVGAADRRARGDGRRTRDRSRSRSPTSRTTCAARRRPAAGRCCGSRSTAPSPLLKGGLAFVDTPGVGGHGQPHLSATLGLLPDADAMLMVQRHQPGVHRTRDDVHPPGARNLPGRQRLSRPRPICTRTGARSSRPTPRTCSAPASRCR